MWLGQDTGEQHQTTPRLLARGSVTGHAGVSGRHKEVKLQVYSSSKKGFSGVTCTEERKASALKERMLVISCRDQNNDLKQTITQFPGNREVSDSVARPSEKKQADGCHIIHLFRASSRVLLNAHPADRLTNSHDVQSGTRPYHSWTWLSGTKRRCFQLPVKPWRDKGTLAWTWVWAAAVILAWCCPVLAGPGGCPVNAAPPNQSELFCSFLAF